MAGSRLIGLCGHSDAIANLMNTFYLNRDAFDWFARSGSMFVIINDPNELHELRKQGGVLLAIVTSNIPAAARMLAEHADRTVSTPATDHIRFAKVVYEIIYGRPPINRDDPRQVRWL